MPANPDFSKLSNADLLRGNISAHTIAFAGWQDNELKQHGSGVLFKVADSRFVLTASHVLEPAHDKYKIPMFLGARIEDGPGIPLTGLRVMRKDDPHDMALIELRPEVSDGIGKTHKFLNIAQCEFSPSFHPDQPFLVLGFPWVLSPPDRENKVLNSQSSAFFTFPYAGDAASIPNHLYQKELHLLFEHGKGVDSQGMPTSLPAPEGISGCGVWRIARAGITPDQWAPEDFWLVAIEHGKLRETQALVATRLEYLIALLRKHHPELAPSLDLSLPVLT